MWEARRVWAVGLLALRHEASVAWLAGGIHPPAGKDRFRCRGGITCCFERKTDGVACVVHGDDFTFEGPPWALKKVADDLRKVWIIKVRANLGPEPSDDKEVSILNRVVR